VASKTSIWIIIFFISCCEVYSQTPGDSSCFPLEVGNQWIYQTTGYPFADTAAVVDTQRISGKLYYAVKQSYYEYVWFRKEDDKIFIVDTVAIELDTSHVREYLLFDFAADSGKSWEVPLENESLICDYSGTITLESRTDTVETPAGVFTNCIRFSRNVPCADAGIFKEWYAPGTGRVAYLQDSFSGMRTFVLSALHIPTALNDSPESYHALRFMLLRNYPNPFNPRTWIVFELPRQLDVVVDIYDIRGRKIKTLVDACLNYGLHSVEWDASDQASGVYFCTIYTGDFTRTIKLQLIR